jgi:hypothetical protein
MFRLLNMKTFAKRPHVSKQLKRGVSHAVWCEACEWSWSCPLQHTRFPNGFLTVLRAPGQENAGNSNGVMVINGWCQGNQAFSNDVTSEIEFTLQFITP